MKNLRWLSSALVLPFIKKSSVLLWLPVFLLLLPLAAFGALEWKKKTIDYQASPNDEKVTALFYFANIGDKPITILNTKTSCGCTVAELEKETYAPGEMGSLKVTFTFDGRTGPQHKGIQLITDDSKDPIVSLMLNVDVPQFVSVEPQLLYWTSGEKPSTKTASIVVLADEPIFIKSMENGDENFTCELVRREDGRRYELKATPKTTANPTEGKVTLTTSVGKEHPRLVFVILQVY